MKLTPHFTLEELIFSQTAVRNGINNNPSQAVKNNLQVLANNLEKVRDLLGKPLNISSGFRCSELNRKLGGSLKSAHMDGYAADFTCEAYGSPKEVLEAIKSSDIKYDQMIYEGTWVHISFDPAMRQQTLKAKFSNGIASYSNY
jgi:hypothetical protein